MIPMMMMMILEAGGAYNVNRAVACAIQNRTNLRANSNERASRDKTARGRGQ